MILLSGENTSIAAYLLPILRDEYQVCSFDSEKGDISDQNFVDRIFNEIAPTVFINLEEISDLGKAEVLREWAYNVNAFAPGHIASLCREHNIFFIHISTTLFYKSSSEGPVDEKALVEPLSVYADSKLLGEEKIQTECERYCILRLPFVYGRGNSFLYPYLSKMKQKKTISIIRNQRIMPVYALDVARLLLHIVKNSLEGIYNFAGPDEFSMYDFLFRAFDTYNRLNKSTFDPKVEEVDYDRFLASFGVPFQNRVNSSKVLSHCDIHYTPIESALKETLGA